VLSNAKAILWEGATFVIPNAAHASVIEFVAAAFLLRKTLRNDTGAPTICLMQNSIQDLHPIATWKFAMSDPRALTNL
jgi:hypothetical protein